MPAPSPSLDRLAEWSLVPDRCLSVFFSGSLTAGWAHANSDADVYVVTSGTPAVEATAFQPVDLDPRSVPIVVKFSDTGRWDVEYWTEGQIEQIFEKISSFDPTSFVPPPELSWVEVDILYRLSAGQALHGADWLDEKKRELEASPLRTVLTLNAFDAADDLLDDAVGQLETSDVESATLAARRAFGYAVDGLLFSYGELSPNEKWRARKMRRATPAELSWDEYWRIETMAGYGDVGPERWVASVVARTRDLVAAVEIA